jgi:hypothetical protein
MPDQPLDPPGGTFRPDAVEALRREVVSPAARAALERSPAILSSGFGGFGSALTPDRLDRYIEAAELDAASYLAEAIALRALQRGPGGDAVSGAPPCPCECNRGGFCGGCGHPGCGRRQRVEGPTPAGGAYALLIWDDHGGEATEYDAEDRPIARAYFQSGGDG